jgi:HJR/Mrr/RecB family endonuclease
MNPDTFEIFCAYLWSRLGYNSSYRTPQSGDGGVDVVALNERKGALIQCKTSRNKNALLGWDAIKDVVTGAAAYEKRHRGIDFEKICITNQYFNDNTKRQAELNTVELYDQSRINEMLKLHKITFLDIHRPGFEFSADPSEDNVI